MAERSIFDLDPDQLDRLLSIGEESVEEQNSKRQEAQADQGRVRSDGKPDSADEQGFINPTASLVTIAEKPGGWIGHYKLLSILGEGGMGIVYLAEQQRPIKRRVALKIIKPGMDSKRVIARFEAERQALALLDHPNIAHVHDAGMTQAGRPYFVMEYTKGLPITDYCDRHKLTIEERLNLFQQVCLAVHHAHQKGIIHRDIKPSNILVSTESNRAIPKIIDFGVAKAISQPLTERTLFTEDSQLIGTPEYMSPEQAEMAAEDIDTRSDIYSLGVLLYVLLAGILPYDSQTFRQGGIEHIRKIIRETDPKTPSTRLTKLGQKAKKLAESRRTEVMALAKCLHRELEWIPLKAMRKERAERYRSAFELADDIENYLKGAPLLAGSLTARYRLRKFVRRNRGVFVAGAVVIAVLVLGVLVSTWQAVRATKAKQAESRLRQQAQANELQTRRIAYASDMSLAQQALAMNDLGRAQRLLDAHQPAPGELDLRGWEWRYLWQECRSDAIGELFHYPPMAFSVAYSPDGRVLAVAGGPDRQGFVDIWDVPGRKKIKDLQTKEASRSHVEFSPGGNLLAAGASNQIQIWRTDTWELVHQIPLANNVMVLKFSPDETRLAGLSLPDEVTLWDTSRWTVIHQVRSNRFGWTWLGDLDFSPDGKALVIGDADHHLQVIDLASGNTILDPWEAHSEDITSVAWSPNGSVIASGSGWEGGPIRLWDAASGKPLGELKGHTSWISDMVFSKDGLRLYSSSGDQTIRIWDVAQQRCLATLRGSSHEVLGLALSPDGATLASACKDGVVAFWSADPQQEEPMPRVIPLRRFARPAFAPDSRVLAVPQGDTVSLFDLATAKETEPLPKMDADVSAVTYSPDGTLLVSGHENGRIRVWSCAGRRLLRELDGHKEQIGLLRFLADGTRLLSLDATGNVIRWDALTWQAGKNFVVERPGRLDNILLDLPDVSPDGRLLALGTETGAVCWLDAETGKLLKTTSGDRGTTQVAFSGDGLRLASTSLYGTVALWDPSSFTWVTSFRAHLLGAHGVAFSHDGTRLATSGGTSQDTVRIWDLSTHRELITLPGQGTSFRSVVFSPDGRWLAACGWGGWGGEFNLWHAPSWEEIEADEKRLKSGQFP